MLLKKCKKISFAIVSLIICMLTTITVFAASDNLLVNTDWEDEMNGWVVEAKNVTAVKDGETLYYSRAYQDVLITEPLFGQKMVLSAKLWAYESQKCIEMGLIFCNMDGSHISELSESEAGTEGTYHEITTAIPTGAAYARVYLTIWKYDNDNTFGFNDLSLTAVQTFPGMQQQEGSFSKADIDGQDTYESSEQGIDYQRIADKIDAYENASCILGDGELWSVGNGDYLGNGTEVYGEAVFVTNDAAVVSQGNRNGAVIKKDGTLWTWGDNSNDQNAYMLGYESDVDALTPVYIMDGVTKVSMGYDHAAAVKSDGTLWMWGDNGKGQLGLEIYDFDGHGVINCSVPECIMDNVADVSCNENSGGFTMVLKKDGTLWTFGNDDNGQLGVGTTDLTTHVIGVDSQGIEINDRPRTAEPQKIMDNVICISAGRLTAACVQADGSVWTWGRNNNGQVGNGGEYNAITEYEEVPCQTSPVKILDNAVSVSMGYDHGAALKSDGTVWCWGYNWQGQLGTGVSPAYGGDQKGGEEFYTTPQKANIEDVVAIAAGNQFTIAVKSDGTVWAWGSLSHVFSSAEPVQIFADQPLMEFDDVVGAAG